MSQNRKKQIDLFKGLTEKELSHKINEIRRELFKARLMIKSSSLKDVSIVKNLKKDICLQKILAD